MLGRLLSQKRSCKWALTGQRTHQNSVASVRGSLTAKPTHVAPSSGSTEKKVPEKPPTRSLREGSESWVGKMPRNPCFRDCCWMYLVHLHRCPYCWTRNPFYQHRLVMLIQNDFREFVGDYLPHLPQLCSGDDRAMMNAAMHVASLHTLDQLRAFDDVGHTDVVG